VYVPLHDDDDVLGVRYLYSFALASPADALSAMSADVTVISPIYGCELGGRGTPTDDGVTVEMFPHSCWPDGTGSVPDGIAAELGNVDVHVVVPEISGPVRSVPPGPPCPCPHHVHSPK
jgi:hypothetical protein